MASPHLILRHAIVEISHTVVQRTDLYWRTAIELQTPTLSILHAEPAHIGVVATLLRTHIGEILISHAVLIDADKLRVVAIDIVFYRTTSVILHLSKRFWHLKLHTITEHRYNLGILGGRELLTYHHLTVCLQCVSHRQRSLHIRHLEGGDSAISLHLDTLQFHLGLAPYGKALLQPGAVVVVGRRTPELRGYRLTVCQHRRAVHVEIINPATLFADGKCRTSCLETYITDGLFYFQTRVSRSRIKGWELIVLE